MPVNMATIDDDQHHRRKRWLIFPFWQSTTASSSSSTQIIHNQSQTNSPQNGDVASFTRSSWTIFSFAKLILPRQRRLRLDPSSKFYFPYEAGKQVRSAVRIKNSSKSHVAFKFQTTAPKSCFMRPPGGILAPGENLIATVFKFVESMYLKRKVKFRIMSLKVTEGIEYVPELFDEQWDRATVERVMEAVLLDPERANPALEKLKRQLDEADAAVESRRKPPADTGPKVVREGLVIDEWKERREKYLARQQVEAVDSI